jgi:hypothetical protein
MFVVKLFNEYEVIVEALAAINGAGVPVLSIFIVRGPRNLKPTARALLTSLKLITDKLGLAACA